MHWQGRLAALFVVLARWREMDSNFRFRARRNQEISGTRLKISPNWWIILWKRSALAGRTKAFLNDLKSLHKS